MDVIQVSVHMLQEFMSRYQREYDYYQQLASLCAERCETGLRQRGIRAIVTFRAKNPDRLHEKLNQRHERKSYSCIDDIYHDIVDLAGVRIALYFPQDKQEVEKFIGDEFAIQVHRNDFPPKDLPIYRKRFSGYEADHYQVRLRQEKIIEAHVRYCESVVEIQVASVLMHAWSEVEHDLIYKPFSGDLSAEEHAILDEINGLVLAGEIALGRLQQAVKERVSKGAEPFRNQYELSSYLSNTLTRAEPDAFMGRVDILLRFLQLSDMDRPKIIDKYISTVDPSNENRPIADQVTDAILLGNEHLYEVYKQARREIDTRRPDSTSNSALGYFIGKWIVLESILDTVAKQINPENSRGPIFARRGSISGMFGDSSTLSQIERLRKIRNETVHGVKAYDSETLAEAGREIEEIIRRLGDTATVEAKKVIRDSKDIQNLIQENSPHSIDHT